METVQKSKPSEQSNLVIVHGNGHDKPSPPGEAAPVLTPDESTFNAARVVLGFYLDQLMANESGTIEGDEPEPLRRMRAATRRLDVALVDFAPAFVKDRLTGVEENIHWLRGLVGRIRDLDVFLEWCKSYDQASPVEEHPYIRRVIENYELARVRERAALLTGLRSPRYKELTNSLAAMVHDNSSIPASHSQPLRDVAIARIKRRLKRVRTAHQGADQQHRTRLHKLRIESKLLRYTAETFQSLFPEELKKLAKRAKTVQDKLGVVHDTHLEAELLKEMRRNVSTNSDFCAVLDRMIETLEGMRDRAYAESKRDYKRLASNRARKRLMRRLRSANG